MWKLNNTQIFVQKYTSVDKQTVARLSPLNGGTVHQVFGYEDPTYTIGGLVVGDTDMDALKALAKTGLTYTLSGPYGVVGTFYVSNVDSDMTDITYQTMRTDLDCESPVYNIGIELYEDV